MWFDAFAKLVEIVAPPCDIRDNCDTGRQFSNCCDVSVITVSRMSQVSQRPPRQKPKPARAVRARGLCDIRDNCDTGRQFSNYCVADVASVATPPAPETETRARRPGRVYFPNGES